MGLEQVAEILLDQALPRLTPPQDYVLLDARCDDDGRRLACRQCRWLTGFGRSGCRLFGWFSGHHFPDLEVAPAPAAQPKV